MKRTDRLTFGFLFALLLSSFASASQNAPSVGIAGRWEADGLPGGPWTFDLNPEGATVVGWISQHGGVSGPVEIFDGRINGSTVTFKARNPVVSTVTKLITFTGKMNGDAIDFTREIELVVIGPERAPTVEMGVFGQSGPVRFTARKTGPAPLPAVAFRPSTVPVDVTGHWEGLRWNEDVWIADLQSNGTSLTGTLSATGGVGRETNSKQPAVPIFEGRVDGNTISFKAKSDARIVQLVGKVQGNEIAFARTLQLELTATQGGDQLFGSYASNAFVAKRINAGTPENETHKAIASAKTKWSAHTFRQYEFDVTWQCTCPLPARAYSYKVKGTAGTAVMDDSVRASLRGVIPQAQQAVLERYGTIDRLFDLLLEVAERQPYSTKVVYDPKLGYPVSAEVHPSGISIVDDFRFTITNFRVVE